MGQWVKPDPTNPEAFEFATSELKDLVNRWCEWTKNGQIKHRQRQQLLSEVFTEKQMSELDQYMGNGLGHVSVGGELSHSKEFGCGAKAFVSISVTCDGNIEVCQQVHDIVQPVVRCLINEDVRMMMQDRDLVMGEAGPRAGQAQVDQGRTAAPAAVGRPMPSFRRG